MRKSCIVVVWVLGAGSGAAGQIVIDEGGEVWTVVEGIGDLAGPEGSVDLLEMKAAVTAVDSDGDVLLLLLLGNFGKPSS